MAELVETCRGTVAPWECDVTEHFTIAYYLDRIDQSAANLADRLELTEALRAGVLPRRFALRFTRELRAGDAFHIESAPIGLEPLLRLGHRIVDSATAEVVTWVEEVWESPSSRLPGERRQALSQHLTSWEGPPPELRPEPKTMAGAIASARGRVRPADLDELGHFSLCAFVHRFTDALLQTTAALGMSSSYAKEQRRGYSTFELGLHILCAPRLGDHYLVETGIAHLGGSSARFVHRMSDPHTGKEFARLSQFGVQLDLDARRPAPFPDAIRTAAAALMLPVE